MEADQELQQKLQQVAATLKVAEARAKTTKTRSKKIEDRLQLAKTEVDKWLDAKDDLIQRLRQQLAKQGKISNKTQNRSRSLKNMSRSKKHTLRYNSRKINTTHLIEREICSRARGMGLCEIGF